MRLAWAIIVLFFVRFFVSAWFNPGQEGDLAWQQWLGSYVLHQHQLPHALGPETFTAPGARWIPQEWAFSLALAAATAHGHFEWLALAAALAAAAALVITAWRAQRRGASTFAVGVVTFCAGFAMLQSFGVRAQIFAWLFLSLVLLLLELENAWIYVAIPLVALWANVHASAAIAPVIVALWTAGTWIEDRAWTPRVERNVVLTAGTVLALFCTPLLWDLPRYALELQSSGIRGSIAEWQPSDILDPSLIAGVLPLIGICMYFGIAAPRERWRDGMLFALATAIAFAAVRHLPLAAFILAPMAAQRLASAIPQHSRINAVLHEHFSETIVTASTALASAVIVVNLLHTPAIAGVALPHAAVAALARVPGTHNLYCEDFSWCSLALQKRNLRTFLDGRCDPFPPRVWADYLDIERLTPRWDSLLAHDKVDAMLVRKGHPLAQALALRNDWRLFYRDGRYEVFLRNGVQTAERQ
jgi:hypothetical protein